MSVIAFAIAGAGANGGLVAIWVASRTIGLPIGSSPWMPEAVMAPDVTATLLELLLVAGALVLIRRRGLPRAGPSGPSPFLGGASQNERDVRP